MFTRTTQLIGYDGFRALQEARVIIFGVGDGMTRISLVHVE